MLLILLLKILLPTFYGQNEEAFAIGWDLSKSSLDRRCAKNELQLEVLEILNQHTKPTYVECTINRMNHPFQGDVGGLVPDLHGVEWNTPSSSSTYHQWTTNLVLFGSSSRKPFPQALWLVNEGVSFLCVPFVG